MKIVSTGGTLSSLEYLEKKIKARRKRRMIYGAVVVVVLIILSFVSRLDKLRVKSVAVLGANVTGAETVSGAVNELLGGYYLWLIPRNSILFFPRGKIEEALALRFPRFSNIEVSLEGMETLKVEVAEREPHALYCASTELCWFLDEQGFIFDFAPTFSEGVYLVYTTEPALEDPVGRSLIGADQFQALNRFILRLSVLGLQPLSVKIGQTDVDLALFGGAEVMLSRENDLDRTFINLESFLNSPTIKAQKDFLEKVSGLDLRTEDKVFYRFNE